nr:putative ribonuclease H-like domain-containing protein [Tanacetum cinerariifolium]
KFDGKANEEFLVGYSVSRSGPTWLFDIDTLTQSMNYQPVVAGNQPNSSADPQNTDVDTTFKVKEPESKVLVSLSSSAKTKKHNDKTKREPNSTNSTNTFSAAGPSNNAVTLEDITYLDNEEYVGAKADFSNLETNITVKEPKRVHQALKDPSWIEAMQEKLFQFKMQKVWVLVDFPKGKRAIGSKWVFRNKKDERGIVVRNKARVVAQRHTQEKGIDYEEVFSTVARIEAIRNSGLHQAPRAWYETLANYLLENGFQRGKIDQTLFIKKQKGDILLVQVYVDDIILDLPIKTRVKLLRS